jgi:nucleotide-binding universal stress UspA family protein
MPLKDLLVYVSTDPAGTARVDVAARLAVYHDAHLTGLHVMEWASIPGYVQAQLPPDFLRMEGQRLREEAAAAERIYTSRARAVGARAEWRAIEGEIVDTVQLHARYADLAVVGQGVDLDGAPFALTLLPEELVLAVGRPVLVVPRYGTFPALGDHVLVAWNGSREATRAVNDALPILQRATKVTVVSVNPQGAADRRVPSADITLHLARHGINATAAQTAAAEISIGDVLLSYAADLGADLIIAGAYGHSRLREMVLGGATHHLLQHMTVPVLFSH